MSEASRPADNDSSIEQTRKAYNRMSRFYDLLASSEKRFIRKGIAKLSIKPGENVLEIGCGTGSALSMLANVVGERGKVTGIDVSEGMLARAKRKLASKGLLNRVELVRGNALNPAFADSTFDALFASFTLELFPAAEIPLLLKESRRVLKRNGRICVVGMSKKEPDTLMQRLYESAHRHFPKYVDCRPIQIGRTIENAGFRVAESENLNMWGLGVEIVLAFR